MARVLLARNNPVIAAAMEAAVGTREKELGQAHERELLARDAEHEKELLAREQRERQQMRKMILRLCDVLAILVTAERRAHMQAMDGEELDRLCSAISEQRRWPENL